MSNPRSIPVVTRSNWIPSDLSETPGGTVYAMTPGGTKITYPRETLLMLQASPHSKSPLNFSAFPGLSKATHAAPVPVEAEPTPAPAAVVADNDMFPMEDH